MKYIINDQNHIVAVKEGPWGSPGTVGGKVAGPDNLSQNGNCWIYPNAKAIEDSRVRSNALLHGHSTASGNAIIEDNATLFDDSSVYENGHIRGDAQLRHSSRVYGSAFINDNVGLFHDTKAFENASLYNHVRMMGRAVARQNTSLHDYTTLADDAVARGTSAVGGHARISDTACIEGTASLMNGSLYGSAVLTGSAKMDGGVLQEGRHSWVQLWANCEGYSKLICEKDGVAYIGAGCRWFNLEDAIHHWKSKEEYRPMTNALLEGAKAVARSKGLFFSESEADEKESA